MPHAILHDQPPCFKIYAGGRILLFAVIYRRVDVCIMIGDGQSKSSPFLYKNGQLAQMLNSGGGNVLESGMGCSAVKKSAFLQSQVILSQKQTAA